MTIPMTSSQWAEFIEPIVRKEWLQKLTAVRSPLEGFFGIETSSNAKEYSQGVGALGLVPEINSSEAEGGSSGFEYADFDPLYETTFTHKEYALGIAIERKLWDDLNTSTIKRRAQDLGNSFGTTIAHHMSSVLNNAFESTVVGGDSVSLCNANHPINKRSSTVFSNAGSTAFSYDAVVATLLAGANMEDDQGEPMPIVYDTIYVPTALQAEAFEVTKAIGKPGTADNDANFLRDVELTTVVDPYLTDANNWFMLSSGLSDMHLLWYWRIRPEMAMDPASDFNLEARYRGYMRYSFGWDDARFIYGHEVT